MSFQYINPYYLNNSYNNSNNFAFSPVKTPAVQMPVSNPYGVSLYNNQNVIYPYNPLFQPVINNNKPYTLQEIIEAPNGDKAHLFKLNNGHSVAIIPKPTGATIVKTFVNTGSITETDDISGSHHVKEHAHFLGSKNLQNGDVFRLTGLMGASTNASTDYAKVDYYITAPYMDENNLKKTIEIQGDMLSNPTFDPKALESEKEPVCSEISMINDDPSTRAFDKVIRNLFQIQSDSENLVAGSIATVKKLTGDDLKQLQKIYYTPQNMSTVVVGDVDVDKTIDLISKNFSFVDSSIAQNSRPLNPVQNALREDYISTKTNTTTAFLGFCGPKSKDSKDFVLAKMLDFYLSQCSSSKFKQELEKLNASYDSAIQRVGLSEDDNNAMITLLTLNPNDEQRGLDLFYDAIFRLQTEPLSDDELKSAKINMLKQYAIDMSDSQAVCNFVGENMMNNTLHSFSDYKDMINSTTKEDLMNFARKYYDLSKVSIVVVHPSCVKRNDIDENYSKSKYSQNNLKNNPISFTGEKKISTKSVEEYVLDNNTRLAVNDTDSELCVFNWTINTPPIKPKNPNIPAVMSYIFEKGTDYKTQLEMERYKELNGINSSVYVNGRSIEIYADCLAPDTDKTLKLMNELMYHPKFTQNDFEEALSYVRDTLNASDKSATANLFDKLYPGFFPTKSQMLKELDKLKLSDIEEFYNELLKNGASTCVATITANQYNSLKSIVVENQNKGDIKFQELTNKLTPAFEPEKEATVVYDTDDLNQAQIYKSYKFPMSGNIEDETKFELVNTILGGSANARLFTDLREKQNLAYSVSSTIQSFENTGILTMKIQTTTDNPEAGITSYDNVQKSLEGFKKHTNALCSELVSDEELSAAKMRLKQNLIGQCQNPITETGLIAMNILEPYGIKRIEKYYEIIDKITKEDIRKAARFIFSYKPTISVLASENTIKNQMDYLKTQGTMKQAS